MNDKPQVTLNEKQISSNVLELKSYSKINLGLWIKEKTPDGYHEIETIYFENDNLYDDIEIQFKESKSLSVNVSFKQEELNNLILPENNLAYKAALLFLNKAGITGSCNINLNKNIPIEAGLGGGSSNAACVLKGLNQIFNHCSSEAELLILGSQIGSDVPFFILGKTCFARGRGEKLLRIENKLNLQVKIVKMEKLHISTKWAYDQIDSREFIADHRREIDCLVKAMKDCNYDLFFKSIFNDFEMVVFSFYLELINERKKLLDEGYKAVSLCGSGSSVFGVKEKKNQNDI